MNIPPFPAHDLAKLVLGYLAEEQLMTAYDEFLTASPYLDAIRNEYDRIFMTSLKNILAEYRAVKIYVETCKPFSLRRRLFGCTNLLEVVKFLIQHVDVNKIQPAESKRGSATEKSGPCVVCNSLKLSSCVCKSRHSLQANSYHAEETTEGNTLESSVETTPLEDLPGNHVTVRKKHVKTLPKENGIPQPVLNSEMDIESNDRPTYMQCEQTTTNSTPSEQNRLSQNKTSMLSSEASETINPVTLQRVDQNDVCFSNSHFYDRVENSSNNVLSNNIPTATTFQDFTDGVRGSENLNSIVPDSSISENVTAQSSITNDICTPLITKDVNPVNNTKPMTNAHIFLTVGTIKNNIPPQENIGSNDKVAGNTDGSVRPKANDQKVTILSDIKVDKTYEATNMPAVLKNATSTPLLHMQTILINGTPVYKHQLPKLAPTRNYTKDEIMAMPTIIVVPTSAPPQIPENIQPVIARPRPINPPHSTISSIPSYAPLVIDVPSNDLALQHNQTKGLNNIFNSDQHNEKEPRMLVQTVDAKNVSAPKDIDATNKNTPQVVPLIKKSSSTPRRTSHVRVLDFTTPRRILQEPISENATESDQAPIEVVISRSPNLHALADPTSINNEDCKGSGQKNNTERFKSNDTGSSKENEKIMYTAPHKKSNWDDNLRALAIPNKKEDIPTSNIHRRCPMTKKKITKKNTSENKSTKKNKNLKKKPVVDELNEDSVIVVDDTTSVPVKPNINIVNGADWNSPQENDQSLNNKSDNVEQTDTPEMDRISLQNAIGAKLNISDLLETPYKQALYDIQMETPRFLGPDLPGEPLSDIKIMNIPTPRFLNNPTSVQATPSSYSSRPTDYSSGGSYYKPDDQDYLPVEDLGYLNSSTKNTDKINSEVAVANKKASKSKAAAKSSRPVRKCRKNVSYCDISATGKVKEVDNKIEVGSTCSKTLSEKNASETKNSKGLMSKSDNKQTKKRNSTSRKIKTLVKKESPKSFMKIKPRRITPTKENLNGKIIRKRAEVQARRRKNSKEGMVESTPVVVSVPMKSRRKSSTPRKLHCTKIFNSESSGHESPEMTVKTQENVVQGSNLPSVQDSDNEQIPLRWSDDGSQDAKQNKVLPNHSAVVNEAEDIAKIQEYIASELYNATINQKSNEIESNLHVDLVKRGFDIETAKIIERDLLDTPPYPKENNTSSNNNNSSEAIGTKNDEVVLEKNLKSDTSTRLQIVQDEEECEEIELSVKDCNEESENYITCHHDDIEDILQMSPAKLKDKFSIEVCIDDGVVVRLRATPLTVLIDQDSPDMEPYINEQETEMAVSSITNIDRLYTPMKDSLRAQVYEIFDSTLTSLDTPLKVRSPKQKEYDTTIAEIVLEVEKLDEKDKTEGRRRKRLHSQESNDSGTSSKRAKPDTQYLLTSANIQNIDIETVLSKLHGP